MEIAGEVRLDAARHVVWEALNDPSVLKVSIPGCDELSKESDTEFSATVTSKVGPIKARFAGKVMLSNINAPVSYSLTGEGQGGLAGFAKANIDVMLDALDEKTTQLRYTVAANVGGKLAQLGTRLIDSTARKMADDFFERFAGAVRESLSATTSAAPTLTPAMLFADVTPDNAVRQEVRAPSPAVTANALEVQADSARLVPPAGVPSELVDVWANEQIKLWISDSIAVVTLNRPKSRNAMTYAMWRAIPPIFGALQRNPEVRAIILTGAGDDFCAGADISEFSSVRASAHQGREYEIAVDACCDAIANVSKPTIAVVKGYCLGGGAHLAMSCDFRYADETAKFGIPAAGLSIIYGVSGTKKLLSLVGLSQAKKILYGAKQFSASHALDIGFIDFLSGSAVRQKKESILHFLSGLYTSGFGNEDPMVEARALARSFTEGAPLTIAGAKYILNGLAMGNGELSPEEAEVLIAAAVASDDYKEGRTAFIEKRKPMFRGC